MLALIQIKVNGAVYLPLQHPDERPASYGEKISYR
jgi:hypothetical protein